MRHAFLLPLVVTTTLLAACDEPKGTGGEASASAAAAKPAIQVVVRRVSVQKKITGPPPVRGAEPETWTAFEGKIYAVVTADLVHNSCKEGDKLDAGKASLKLPDGGKAELKGGGANKDSLCVLCQPSEKLACSGGQAGMRPFTFIFSVPEKADVSKATLSYSGVESALSDGELTDRRGNDDLDREIEAKKQQLAVLKKKLENTSNTANGKIILGEMDVLKKKIEALEKKRR